MTEDVIERFHEQDHCRGYWKPDAAWYACRFVSWKSKGRGPCPKVMWADGSMSLLQVDEIREPTANEKENIERQVASVRQARKRARDEGVPEPRFGLEPAPKLGRLEPHAMCRGAWGAFPNLEMATDWHYQHFQDSETSINTSRIGNAPMRQDASNISVHGQHDSGVLSSSSVVGPPSTRGTTSEFKENCKKLPQPKTLQKKEVVAATVSTQEAETTSEFKTPMEQLKEAKMLLDAGLIEKEDYDALKEKVLAGLAGKKLQQPNKLQKKEVVAATVSTLNASEKDFLKAIKDFRAILKLAQTEQTGGQLDAMQKKKLARRGTALSELKALELKLSPSSDLREKNRDILSMQ